jgi:hypothetical protein
MESLEHIEADLLLHTQEVRGSSPCAPTIRISSLRCSTEVICGASVFASPAWPTSMLSFGPPLDVVSLSFSLLALGRGGCSGAWFRPEGGTV